ncbi:hypothetical protein E8E11_009162 [Didymella keratinophila]|nr:hypothetical protein E8E11_009162 [Didymella keratinophila]
MFDTSNYLNGYEAAQIPRFDQSPPMDCLNEAVRQYGVQSPDHFELEVKARQANRPYGKSAKTNPKDNSLTMSFDVQFCGNTIEGPITVLAQCQLHRSGRRTRKKRWACLAVSHSGISEALETFLAATFPVIDGPLRHDTLSLWWLVNEKSFNWTALPIELKERIIQHCMHQPSTYGVYSERLARFHRRHKPDHDIRRPGPFELIEQLGDWLPLLSVSHQVRAVTLRLCISGGGTLPYPEGLCIPASSYRDLRERICRLRDHYQTTTANCVPVSPAEQSLSKT